MSERPLKDDSGVTVVTQTRVVPDKAEAFARWQDGISHIVSSQPGFVRQTVMPPAAPAQLDWVILQNFDNTESALSWLRSAERQRLVAEARPMLVGADDVHLVADSKPGVLPAPVSAVISTRIKPGQEAAYRQWEQRIAAAQARSPGFQGYRFEPPIPGVQDDWLTILRFDSDANLQIWMDSPERKKLLEEAAAFTEEFHARIVRTGFDQWFHFGKANESPPPAWKQNMLVLMTLYPVVYLITVWIDRPFVSGKLGLVHWSALFVDNVISVLLLSLIAPWVNRRFDWWLRPDTPDAKRDILAMALILGIYALSLFMFWQYDVHFWLPQ